MPKGKPRVVKMHAVSLDFVWPQEKYDVIREMAKRNDLSLADMVDEILDDWAALANQELGDSSVPRVLQIPPEATAAWKKRNGVAE